MKRKTYTITGNGQTATAHAWNSALRKSATLLPEGKWLRVLCTHSLDFTFGGVTWKNRKTGECVDVFIKQTGGE